jgi:uncharacterized protein YbjT (DUF2867 family)
VYLTYYPDLALPGGVEATRASRSSRYDGASPGWRFCPAAASPRRSGEQAVRETGAELTVLRSTWFMPNFSEDYMLAHVLSGEIRLPAGDVPTPFLDADDIADVAVAALTDDRHIGRLYELTGPRSLTFDQVAAELSAAIGREIRYVPVSLEQHAAEAAEQGVPDEMIELLTYLFSEVVDGRNAATTDGVRQALGREPRDFADYARSAAATGVGHDIGSATPESYERSSEASLG